MLELILVGLGAVAVFVLAVLLLLIAYRQSEQRSAQADVALRAKSRPWL